MFKVARPAEPSERSRAARFSSSESGTVAILFALTALVVMSMVGGAIDYGRAVHARYQIQEAVDSAVLAAARVWQTEHDIVVAQEKGTIHYENNKPKMFSSEVATFTPDFVNNTISMSATGLVPTPFLSLIRSAGYTVGAASTARLQIGGGSNADTVEVSVMLDVTGSMCSWGSSCSSGRKIDALKSAATKLIDVVIMDSESDATKVAIVPFSVAVRLPDSANQAARGTPPATKTVTYTSRDRTRSATYYLTPCVVERSGTEKYSDAAPAPGQYVMAHYSQNGSCLGSGATLMPLTSDKDKLKNAVKNLTATGSTAGHLGTAWAWYVLSPNWNSLWPSSAAKPYGTRKLTKYAILMTDGEYNIQYDANGIATGSTGAGPAANGSSTTQARSLCTEMKKAGKDIVVYTIGFELGGSTSESYKTLQQCASSPDKFFDAKDEVQLQSAFEAIARQIATISLSQ